MAIVTLQSIINKVRRFVGAGSSQSRTDEQIIDYINSFYLYTFPAQFRSLKLQDTYTFSTTRGIDTYPFDSEHYTTVQMPCYVRDRQVTLCNDPGGFYAMNINWQDQQTLATGNGTTGTYSGTISATPLIRSVNNNPISATLQNPTLRS